MITFATPDDIEKFHLGGIPSAYAFVGGSCVSLMRHGRMVFPGSLNLIHVSLIVDGFGVRSVITVCRTVESKI